MRLGLATLAVALLMEGRAEAVDVNCGSNQGDTFGWAVDAGADYDGDGTADFAVGAPCAAIGGAEKVGRARVFSGATGRRLLSVKGGDDNPDTDDKDQQFGAAVALLPDVDGDGKAELAVGSSTYSVPKDGGGVIRSAGKVEVFSSKGGVLWTLLGATQDADVGEALAAIADVNADGKGDLLVGASGFKVDGFRKGSALIVSGLSGAVLGQNDGEYKNDLWGSTVGSIADVNGDGHADLVVAANSADRPLDEAMAAAWSSTEDGGEAAADTTTTTTTTTTAEPTTTTTLKIVVEADVGKVKILSGLAPFAELARMEGNVDERLGRSVAATADLTGDSKEDLWIGSIGKNVGNQAKAGILALYDSAGVFQRSITEPSPQAGSAFGTAVVVPGSLNGDGVEDPVASAPVATVSGKAEAGRVHAFNGTSGAELWIRNGGIAGSRFGQSLASGFDYNHDSIPDVLVGAPGDAPAGRRGAGAVYVLSGANGERLARFGGRRGRETRLFVSGRGDSRRPLLRSFDPSGHSRELDFAPFRRQKGVAVSLAVLDDGGNADFPTPLIAVGTGTGGSGPQVSVYRAGRKSSRVTKAFAAGPLSYNGGVNVAAGDLSAEAGDEIAVAPADDSGGTIDVVIQRRTSTDPLGRIVWNQASTFHLFASGDKVANRDVNAVGVNLAAGNLTSAAGDELVAGPVVGLPAVRVFARAGGQIDQWLAFPPEGSTGDTPNVGVAVAVGDLDGSGFSEIVTAPASGQLWIKAWTANGLPFKLNGKEVNFFVNDYGQSFVGGLRVAVADVDLDGQGEILVGPGPGISAPILAFEADGKPVAGWVPFLPMGPGARSGVMLAGTDNFRRP